MTTNRGVTSYEDAPLSRFHIRVAITGTGGQFSDGFILGIIGIVVAVASDPLGLTPAWIGLLGAGTLAGLFIGALATGPIADRYGRKMFFLWGMLAFAVLSSIQFFVQNAEQLLVLRLLLGVVLGADYVVSKSLVSELSPRRLRGRLMSCLAVAWAVGYACAYLAGFALSGTGESSWRYMLVLSAVPALIVFAFRIGIPESPAWLVNHGCQEKAMAIVIRRLGADYSVPEPSPVQTGRRISTLFSSAYRKNTVVCCVVYVCLVIPYFALGTFSSQVIGSLGVTNKLAAGAVYNVFLIVGAVGGLLIVDRITRRQFLVYAFSSGAITMGALTLFGGMSGWIAVVLFALFAFLLSGANNLAFVYPPELFPPNLRASGVGIATAASRIGSATTTFLLPVVVASFSITWALGGCVLVMVVGAVVCWLWAPETANQSVNGLGQDHRTQDDMANGAAATRP